jgi:hypothetical protein
MPSQRGFRLHVHYGRQAHFRIAPKRVLQVLRRCDAVSRVMGRIWIAMGMEWGVSLGGGDADVREKQKPKRGL